MDWNLWILLLLTEKEKFTVERFHNLKPPWGPRVSCSQTSLKLYGFLLKKINFTLNFTTYDDITLFNLSQQPNKSIKKCSTNLYESRVQKFIV